MSHVETKRPDPLDVALGASIRLRRRALNLTQEALAEACGVTFQQVQKYENGRNRVSFSRLVQIAHALECQPSGLVAAFDEDGAASPVMGFDFEQLLLPGAARWMAAYAKLSTSMRAHLLEVATGLAEAAKREQAEV